MPETNSKINPLIAAAAVAVIIFSAVGVGVMTGLIPSSRSASDANVLAETNKVPAPAIKAIPAPEPTAKAQPSRKPTAPVAQKYSSAAEPRERAAQVATNDRTSAPAVMTRVCSECGVIDSINVIDKKGEGTGLGAVGGAVVGGLLGHQVGSGRGNTIATVVGAVGGGVAGHEVEKHVRSTKEYNVILRMDNGDTRDFTFDSPPTYSVGEKVKVIDGKLVKG